MKKISNIWNYVVRCEKCHELLSIKGGFSYEQNGNTHYICNDCKHYICNDCKNKGFEKIEKIFDRL